MRVAALALVLAGCAQLSGSDSQSPGADAPPAPECRVALTVNPESPVAGPSTTVRVTAQVLDAAGVLGYDWRVHRDGTRIEIRPAQPDGSQIDFDAPLAGTYQIFLDITGSLVPCPTTGRPVVVALAGAVREVVRLRVVPPGGTAPVHEQLRDITGGVTADFGFVGIEAGRLVSATVRGPAGVIPAYLRFAPPGAPDAIVETFADAAGMVSTRLLAQPHDVLVIPSVPGVAPGRITGWSPGTGPGRIDLGAGATVTGTVRDPASAPLAGATVTLSVDGVPSTIAITASDGTFELRAATGTTMIVEVTPPVTSGLPRLSATSQSAPGALAIRYAANLVRRNLVGMAVQRQGAPVARARLMVVGTMTEAGTVTSGTSPPVPATGEVRIAAIADAAGALTSTLVPAAALSAVVTVGDGDLAVAALDTSDGVPATIDAPPMLPIAPLVQGPGGNNLPGALLELVPLGALAMAGVPVVHVTVGGNGKASTSLAAGGRYDLRFHDPRRRAAQLVVADRSTATVETAYRLRKGLVVTGTLLLGGTQPLGNALVQILCDECNGVARAKPVAEAVSDAAGGFVLVVPDPGTS
jgi:hypothetical protein